MSSAISSPPITRKSVLYYVERYLPASQAFVGQQAKALQRYTPSFLAGSRVDSPSARISSAPVHNIASSPSMRAGELALKLVQVPIPALLPAIGQADIVHAHFGKNGYVIGPLARVAGKPLVTTFHGFDATYAGDPKTPGGFNQVRYFRNGRRAMTSWPGWNIAVSDFIAKKLGDLGFPADRVRRHYIGIDTALFANLKVDRKPFRVVSVARFVEYKGHRYIIDALAKVAAAGIPVELVMVGQGPLREEIEAYARRSLPKIEVFDSLSQPEIAQILAGARLYVHGSVTLDNGHAEAFGLANLEAQAAGTPVVCFDSGGVTEAMIMGKTGLAVPERDVNGMADAIGTLLTNDSQWVSFSRDAAEMAKSRFDIFEQTNQLEDIYDEVLKAYHQESGLADSQCQLQR